MTIYVDRRYDGEHGIARYAREVLAHMRSNLIDLPVSGNPTSPLSILDLGWRAPASDDIIYSPGFGSGFSRARQLLTLHDLIHLEPQKRSIPYRLYYDRVVRPAVIRCGHVVTVSETSALAIREWLGDSEVNIHVAGNACSKAFTPVGPQHQAPKPYVLYVSNARPHKNPIVAIRAIALLPDYDLIAVSRDEHLLRRMAEDEGVAKQVTVVAGLSDIELASYYRGAAALIFPSLQEGFGLPPLEALCCHTPVVYYQGCAAVRETVGNLGMAVESNSDPEPYAEALVDAFGSRPDASQLRRAFRWENVAARVEETLARIETATRGQA